MTLTHTPNKCSRIQTVWVKEVKRIQSSRVVSTPEKLLCCIFTALIVKEEITWFTLSKCFNVFPLLDARVHYLCSSDGSECLLTHSSAGTKHMHSFESVISRPPSRSKQFAIMSYQTQDVISSHSSSWLVEVNGNGLSGQLWSNFCDRNVLVEADSDNMINCECWYHTFI